jgi:hypothetical protein
MKKLFTTLLLLISFAGFSQHFMSLGGKINLSYVDIHVYAVNWHASTWYGVSGLETSNPDMTRIGTLSKHVSLPVQSLMRGCLLNDDGTINYYLKSTDWTKKADGTASDLTGTDGQVMVEIPQHWVCDWNVGAVQKTAISLDSIKGFRKIPKIYVSAYKAALNRTTLELSSVVNTTTTYRGGNNTSAWDAGDSTLLGKPVSTLTIDNYRDYARYRNGENAKWNCMTWLAVTTMQRLFMIEYATKNSQKAFNATRTAEGYKQGGLGTGVTDANYSYIGAFNNYNPFIPCGTSNSLADSSGEVNYNLLYNAHPATFKVNRYRGIETPFGDVTEYTDGLNVYIDTVNSDVELWVYDNPVDYKTYSIANARFVDTIPDASYYILKSISNYDFTPTNGVTDPDPSVTVYNTYLCDRLGLTRLDGDSYHPHKPYNALRHGGYPYADNNTSTAGLFNFKADNNGSVKTGYIGTRLTYLDIDSATNTVDTSLITSTVIRTDGKTIAWYTYDDLTTITKNGYDSISLWKDKLGSGRNIASTTTGQPRYTFDGVLFNGTTSYMQGTFTYNQPEMIYMVVKKPIWSDGKYLFDGKGTDKGVVFDKATTPGIKAYAGTFSTQNDNMTLDTWVIVRVLFNGANSTLQINGTTATTGNFGASQMAGFTLASRAVVSSTFCNLYVKEVILRNNADDASTQTAIYNYLKTKYGL